LLAALEVVAEQPGSRLRVPELVERIGVTRGSFYWHFEDRSAFLRDLAECWAEVSMAPAVERVAQCESAEQGLRVLLDTILHEDLARYDAALRALAVQEPEVAEVVERVDEKRIEVVRGLFAGLGYRDEDLAIRTRTFVVAMSLDPLLRPGYGRKARQERTDLLYELFTRGAPD
jgi:AcrR family transcriptional regulator